MYDIKIPIVYVEEPHDGWGGAYGRYVPVSFTDIICTVKDAGIDMGQEYTLILAVKDAEGLMPIQIRMPHDPDTYLIQDMYIAALSIEAGALVVFHNIPHGVAIPENDILFYDKVKNAGDKIGIPILDHIILNGGMVYDISDMSVISNSWKGLEVAGCRPARPQFHQYGKERYIMSAYLPKAMEGKKPFTIGI